jgi:acyl carrier protein
MSDQDFLKLLNVVVKLAKPFHDEAPPIDNIKDSLSDHGIDSLDMLMIGLYICDVFGISEEDGKQMKARTVEELRDFLYARATKKDIDVDAAIEGLK